MVEVFACSAMLYYSAAFWMCAMECAVALLRVQLWPWVHFCVWFKNKVGRQAVTCR
jgi:hypothetical protein